MGSDQRPLILGEAPSKSGDKYYLCPLSGAVGERLARWAGLEPQPGGTRYGQWYWPLVAAFECRNLLERYPGPQGRGAALPMGPAREAAAELLPELDGRRVVVLGTRLPAALGLRWPAPMFEWHHFPWLSPSQALLREQGLAVGVGDVEFEYAVIPHPSGLNRAYNDPLVERAASAVLRRCLEPDRPLELL